MRSWGVPGVTLSVGLAAKICISLAESYSMGVLI